MERTLLGDVHPDHHFIARNGARIKNILELYNSIKDMDDISFNHHVNDFKNDFHNWVRDMHKDNELAKALLEASTQKEMVDVLKAKVGDLQTAKPEIKAVVKEEVVKKPEVAKEPIVKKIVKKAVKTIKAVKPVNIIKKKTKVVKAPKEIKEKIKPEKIKIVEEAKPKETKPELKEETVSEPKGELLSEVEEVDKTIPEIGIMEAENIIEQERYYERPRLLRLTPGDFALGLIIGTIAGLIIANLI